MKKILLFLVVFVSMQVHCSNVWHMLTSNHETTGEKAKQLITWLTKKSHSDTYDVEHNWIPDFRYGSYLPFENPIIEKVVKKIVDGQEYQIYIISGDKLEKNSEHEAEFYKTIDGNRLLNEAEIRNVEFDMERKEPGKIFRTKIPYTIALIDDKEEHIYARFRFYIDLEKNEATIYASSMLDKNCNQYAHTLILNEVEKFLKEKEVKNVENKTARMETDQFWYDHDYCDPQVRVFCANIKKLL